MPAICKMCGNCHIGMLIFAPAGVMILIVAEVEAAMSYQEDLVNEEDFVPVHGLSPLPPVNQRDWREFVFA